MAHPIPVKKKLKTGITTGKNRFYHKNGGFSDIEIERSRARSGN